MSSPYQCLAMGSPANGGAMDRFHKIPNCLSVTYRNLFTFAASGLTTTIKCHRFAGSL